MVGPVSGTDDGVDWLLVLEAARRKADRVLTALRRLDHLVLAEVRAGLGERALLTLDLIVGSAGASGPRCRTPSTFKCS